tara:strand:+ start:41798 stop:42409 length:612 start_codon:yes stop_codon:yes gene_type:complete
VFGQRHCETSWRFYYITLKVKNMRTLNEIIVHCTATQADWRDGQSTSAKVAEVKRWHLGNGWSDIGYHYLIDRDGTVATGRPLGTVGAHVSGRNTGTIGISLFGGHGSAASDTFADNFTPAQDAALRKLLADLMAKYSIKKVTGHNEYAAKACPGFKVSTWLADTQRGPDVHPAETADLATEAKLIALVDAVRLLADQHDPRV